MKRLFSHLVAGSVALLTLAACMQSPVVDFQPSTPSMGGKADEIRFAPSRPTPLFYWTHDIEVKVRNKELLSYAHIGDLTVEHDAQLEIPELVAIAHKYQADLVIAELAFEEMGDDVGRKLSSGTVPKDAGSSSDNAVRSWVTSQGVSGAPRYESKQEYSVRKQASHVYRLKLYRKLED